MSSVRLGELKSQIKEFRRHLLPSRFDPTGTYIFADRVAARAASFRMLAHAELEIYFEERAVEIAKAAWSGWKKQRHVSCVALHLLGYSGHEMSRPPATLKAPNNQREKSWESAYLTIHERLEKSISDYVYRILKLNHGVKEENILSMLLPIGFDVRHFDELVLAGLNQFGEARGAAAHSGKSSYVSQAIDPRNEYETVLHLISELEPLDLELERLLLAAIAPEAE